MKAMTIELQSCRSSGAGLRPLPAATGAYKFELNDVRLEWTQYTNAAAPTPAKEREMTD